MLRIIHGCLLISCAACFVGCQTPGTMRGLAISSSRESVSEMNDAPPMRLASGGSNELKSRWSPTEKGSDLQSQAAGLLTAKSPRDSRTTLPDLKAVSDDSELEAFASLPPRERELGQRQLAAVKNQRLQTSVAESPVDESAASLTAEHEPIEPTAEHQPRKESKKPKSSPKKSSIQQVAHVESFEDEVDPETDVAAAEPLSIRSPEIPKTRAVAARNPTAKSIDDYSQQQLFEALHTKLSNEAGATTEDSLRQTVILRTLFVLDDRLDEAVEPIDGLEPSEQQYLHNQLTTLATLIDPKGPPTRSRRYAAAIPFLRESLSHLGAATGKLDVHPPLFCTEVESFGSVTRFEQDRFAPGQQVILYCEVDQFVAKHGTDGFHTHLQGSYEVFDKNGVKVAEQSLPEDKQTCSHYRRDYFIAYRLYLPSHLDPGSYQLQLTMEDHLGKLYGQADTKFEIAAK